eukprot:NODE_234_length_2157_cov_49.762334_g157_i0.p1 GENE.NODE_234_length_2157_cov_49.762334_g157_i0~~NODE_234_length_2157_cov_49.762334_g157_i0.p1  ORF type:complete len:616 (-),score=141.24 NODE_234_length_2157_cov_49.762334_g157_i0:263-2110(-)
MTHQRTPLGVANSILEHQNLRLEGTQKGDAGVEVDGRKRKRSEEKREEEDHPSKQKRDTEELPVEGPSLPPRQPPPLTKVNKDVSEDVQKRTRFEEKLRCSLDLPTTFAGWENQLTLDEPKVEPDLLTAAFTPKEKEKGKEEESTNTKPKGSDAGSDADVDSGDNDSEAEPMAMDEKEDEEEKARKQQIEMPDNTFDKDVEDDSEAILGQLADNDDYVVGELTVNRLLVKPGESLQVSWHGFSCIEGSSIALFPKNHQQTDPIASVSTNALEKGDIDLKIPVRMKGGECVVSFVRHNGTELQSVTVKVLEGILALTLVEDSVSAAECLQVTWSDQSEADFAKFAQSLGCLEVHSASARPIAVANNTSVSEIPALALGKHTLHGSASVPTPQHKGKYSLWYVATDLSTFERKPLGCIRFAVGDEVRLASIKVEPEQVRPGDGVTVTCSITGYSESNCLQIVDNRGTVVDKVISMTYDKASMTCTCRFLTPEHNGLYEVMYCIAFGEPLTKSCKFRVTDKAPLRHFSVSPMEQWPGGVVKLLWDTDKVLPKDHIEIYSEERKRVLKSWRLPEGTVKRQLNVPAPMPGKGRYTLRYVSGSGFVAGEAYFHVTEPPPIR